MKKALDNDLKDLTFILEDIVAKIDKQTLPDLIDLAARLKPVAKHCGEIDDHVKKLVKGKQGGKEGSVLGNLFKAVLKLVPTKRLDQKGLKEAHPKIHAEYCLDVTDERITFELR